MIKKRTYWAIALVASIAKLEETTKGPIKLNDAAQVLGIGRDYADQILKKLVAAEIIVTKRGRSGGINLARKETNASSIRDAIEGDQFSRVDHANGFCLDMRVLMLDIDKAVTKVLMKHDTKEINPEHN